MQHLLSKHQLVWPLTSELTRFEDCLVRHLAKFHGYCNICGRDTEFVVQSENLRETVLCQMCGSSNRQRQLASVILNWLNSNLRPRYLALQDVVEDSDMAIYNTEAGKAIHNIFKNHPKYVCSEYFGPGVESGAYFHGIMHQDLMTLSLESESIDLVISSDVFEHIPDPYRGHQQIYRVLKKGGRHIFTVPFYQTECLDEIRATLGSNGEVTYHMEPIFHGDPLREEGALVFTIFGLEMFVRLAKIGFRVHMWKLRDADAGIMGGNAIVFEACKGS